MYKNEPSKASQIFAACWLIFSMVAPLILVCICLFYTTKCSHVTTPIQQLKEAVEALPDSLLKRNMYTILASEYAGDSQDLNQILQMYSEMKIKELQNGKSL